MVEGRQFGATPAGGFGPAMKRDELTPLDAAEKWLRDGVRAVPPAGFFQTIEVDMSAARRLMEQARAAGHRITYTHILVKATAVALQRQRQLHQMVNGSSRLRPAHIDIGVAVAGPSFVAPNVVVRRAEMKSIEVIAKDIEAEAPKAVAEMRSLIDALNRWGWLVPFSWLRLAVLRSIIRGLAGRRKNIGTFQVSCVRGVDQFVPLLFSNSGILGMGEVRDRVTVVNGQAVVRPTAFITCAADHKVWNGVDGARFLAAVKNTLSEDNLTPIFAEAATGQPAIWDMVAACSARRAPQRQSHLASELDEVT
jgi:pyruvate dehydrogenase E2 component (dihydrolipoamide acetyltransferase)